MSDDEQTENYEVGYGKPPKNGRFKKGISGNPSGRPKKPSDFEAKLLRELNSPLTINENGKRKVITKDEGIAKQGVNKALSANLVWPAPEIEVGECCAGALPDDLNRRDS